MTKIFADGADYDGILNAAANPIVKGFTTNPSLMRSAGITNYMDFCERIIPKLKEIRPDTNISLEVFADEDDEIIRQAEILAGLETRFGYPIYVKIPVMNTKRVPTYDLINKISKKGIRCNVTAVFTALQTSSILDHLDTNTPSIISIFAGRIADAGVDPEYSVKYCINTKTPADKNVEFLWASTREVYNFVQAQNVGCDIITMTPDIIKKLSIIGKPLYDYSYETVCMFFNDAQKSNYTL